MRRGLGDVAQSSPVQCPTSLEIRNRAANIENRLVDAVDDELSIDKPGIVRQPFQPLDSVLALAADITLRQVLQVTQDKAERVPVVTAKPAIRPRRSWPAWIGSDKELVRVAERLEELSRERRSRASVQVGSTSPVLGRNSPTGNASSRTGSRQEPGTAHRGCPETVSARARAQQIAAATLGRGHHQGPGGRGPGSCTAPHDPLIWFRCTGCRCSGVAVFQMIMTCPIWLCPG